MRSIIIHDFSMKRAFFEDSRHFYRVKKFYFWPGRVQRKQLTIDNSAAQREQSQACLNCAEPARNLDALHPNSAAQREQSQARLGYAEPARNLDALHHNSAAQREE